MSRLSQVDSGLITTSSWTSRSRRNSPTNNIYRHSTASSIDSGRSSTALHESPKVILKTNHQILRKKKTFSIFLDRCFIKFYGYW
jgi:hypothetical protein